VSIAPLGQLSIGINHYWSLALDHVVLKAMGFAGIRKNGLQGIGCLMLLCLSLPLAAASVVQQELDAVVRSKPDLNHGEQLFIICAACHASNGGGSENGDVPAIAGQHARVIARQLVNYRHARRWDVRMERIADQHHLNSTQDLADITGYVASMDLQPARASGDGTLVGRGADIYSRLCSTCHGPTAGGDNAQSVPRLAGQHYEYLSRQMYDAVDARRPNFSRQHISLFKRFERADIIGLADYLSRIR
jgi:cytochrome c553